MTESLYFVLATWMVLTAIAAAADAAAGVYKARHAYHTRKHREPAAGYEEPARPATYFPAAARSWDR